MDHDKKQTISFNKTPDEVLRERKNRQELSPQQQADRERMSRLKQPQQPLGGAPPVQIPPLDAEPMEHFKGSMQDQAAALRDPTNPLSPLYEPTLAMATQGGLLAPLPPEAAQQPGFRPGVGSMFAANQPREVAEALQRRRAAVPPPKEGEPYRPSLSPDTQESLRALAEFQRKAQHTQEVSVDETKQDKVQEKAEKLDKDSKSGVPEKEFLNDLKALLDNPKQWDALNNPERRKEIETRCKPMDITDVILHGEVRQEVTIKPKTLTVIYRSVSADEDLAVKRMMFGETGGDRYLMDKYAIMQLTLGIVSINGEPLPSHLTDDKKFDDKLFQKKYETLLRFPIQFIADLGIQYQWFDDRVRELFVGTTEAVKNS